MASQFKLDPSYNDVASRLNDLRDKWPDASCQPVDPARPFWFEQPDEEHLYLVYAAACYRYPEDVRPGIGVAWEPFPGRTPYTKDSEVMVAETSAWGRAIVAALAADTKKGVASSDEIAARAPDTTGLQRAELGEQISALPESARETVKVWMRNHRIPSLKRAGATGEQLDELAEFIAGLGDEPWDMTPVQGEGAEGSTVEQEVAAPSRPEPTFDKEMAHMPGSIRQGLRSTTRTP